MKEEVVLFGTRQSLVGIVTDPATVSAQRARTAVILLNAGIVHRVGPGRIYVKIARALAAMGFVVLRFDFSGIGDSTVRHDHLCFEKSAVAEAQEAMGVLNATRGVEHFIFLGGCSGAFASFETACCDPRVVGAILINFQTPDNENAAAAPDLPIRKAAYYYWKSALFNLKSWRKLLTGKTDYGQLIRVLCFEIKRRFASKKTKTPDISRVEAGLLRLAARRVHVVFVCSEGDPQLQDLRDAGGHTLKQLCASGEVVLDIIPQSDHTFSSVYDQERLLKVACQRMGTIRHYAASRSESTTAGERTSSCQLGQPLPILTAGANSPQGKEL